MVADYQVTPESFRQKLATLDSPYYELMLFVNGASQRSAQAITDVVALCESQLAGRYHLEIVDVHDDLARVIRHRILASPTLLKESPPPVRMLVGDLSDPGRVMAALDIRPVDIKAEKN